MTDNFPRYSRKNRLELSRRIFIDKIKLGISWTEKNISYLLLSDGGIIRPCDLRMCTSLTCLASLCTLGNGGTDFFVLPQPRHWHWYSTSVIRRQYLISRITLTPIRLWLYPPLGAFTNDACTWPFCSAMQWSIQSVMSSNCQSQLSQQHSYTTSCVEFVPTEAVPFSWPPSSFILIARSSQACFSPAGSFRYWNESYFMFCVINFVYVDSYSTWQTVGKIILKMTTALRRWPLFCSRKISIMQLRFTQEYKNIN